MLREGLIDFLEQQPDFHCCGQTHAVAGADLLLTELAPDLVLLDLHLSDGESWGLMEFLQQKLPAIRVLVFSQYPNLDYVSRAMHAGARGYLLKQDAPDAIVQAIRLVMQGRPYFSPSLQLELLQGTLPAWPQSPGEANAG